MAQGRPAIPLLCPQKEPLQKGSLRADPAESSALRSNSKRARPRAKALAGASAWRSAPAWVPLWPQLALARHLFSSLTAFPSRGGGVERLCSSNPDWKQQRPGSMRPDTASLFLGGRMASSVRWGAGGGARNPAWRAAEGCARPVASTEGTQAVTQLGAQEGVARKPEFRPELDSLSPQPCCLPSFSCSLWPESPRNSGGSAFTFRISPLVKGSGKGPSGGKKQR